MLFRHGRMNRFLLCLAALSLAGCRFHGGSTDENRIAAVSALNARRPGSLKHWEHTTFGKENALDYAYSRTALLLPAGMKMMMRAVENTGRLLSFTAIFTGTGSRWFAGSAVALTPDGYFLTASHCVETGACTLVSIDGVFLRSVQTRIVWRGREEIGEPDLALIYAPLSSDEVFTMSGFSAPEKGAAIFTAGFGSRAASGLKAGASGGHIVKAGPVKESPSGARWRRIIHNAPLAPGDSGGPLINEKGELLGINTELDGGSLVFVTRRPSLWFYKASAVSPDANWIRSLIEKDRATHPRSRKRATNHESN